VTIARTIVTKFPGRPGQRTGSRVEDRYFIELWYEGVYPFGTRISNLVCDSVVYGWMTLERCLESRVPRVSKIKKKEKIHKSNIEKIHKSNTCSMDGPHIISMKSPSISAQPAGLNLHLTPPYPFDAPALSSTRDQGFTYRPVRPNRCGPVPVYRSGLAGNRSVPVEVKFKFKFRSSNGSYRYTSQFDRFTSRFDRFISRFDC